MDTLVLLVEARDGLLSYHAQSFEYSVDVRVSVNIDGLRGPPVFYDFPFPRFGCSPDCSRAVCLLTTCLTIRYGNAPMAAPNVFMTTSVPWARPAPEKYCQDSMSVDDRNATRIDHEPRNTDRDKPSG